MTTSSSWLKVATRYSVVVRSMRVSLIVGTILVGINHGDVLLGGGATTVAVWKIPLTYFVPYAVSTYAAVDAILSR
ncbi:MAG: nitrate/nitrite transporter NrtS [Woeseia sp.]|nr:nitrate/nitrite transporter NrtS [Woeseia sp.]NNE60954.1 nitrate/nitrite transporter NrtS [Woeseia sp.]NNL53970.1 nitrate/nitrite transporter NrtS [Woeseia sp.]